MKIAFIIPSLKLAGPVNVVKVLTDELLKDKIEVKVFYFDNKFGTNFNCPTKRITFTSYRELYDFDIIHSHGLRPDLFVFLYKGKFKSRVVSTIHSYIKDDLRYQKGYIYSLVFSFLWNIILTRHDKIILLSMNMQGHYDSFLFNKRLDYVYNCAVVPHKQLLIDKHEDKFFKELNNKYTVLGSVCYISKLKGLQQIITLLQSNPTYAFLVIGDGVYKKTLEDYAKLLNVFDRCFFIGFKKEPYYWLKFMKIFVAPSYTEGFPIAVLEAGLSKKPIICSNLPIYNELFVKNEIEVFENDNIQSLSDAVEKVKNNLELYGNRVFDKIQSSFLPIHAKTKHLSIYNDLLSV